MIDFEIVSTGSKGNAVVFENMLLVDAGVPFSALQKHFKNLQLVLLTHIHGDHFTPSTVAALARERPALRFGCCKWMVVPLLEAGVLKTNIDVYDLDLEYDYGLFRITPFPLVHNVPNCGYKVFFKNGQRMIYATDTSSISHVKAEGYDLYLVEANHTRQDLVERIRQKQQEGVYCYEYEVIKNHLSREKADEWLYENMSSTSRYVYLHGHVEAE